MREVLRDGVVEEEERQDLTQFLERAAGVEGTERFDGPTTLPLTHPEPHIEYEGKAFCITGTFIYGPRRKVEAAIAEWGCTVVASPAPAHYLVIGATVTPSWKYGVHGLKIQEAVELIGRGKQLAIVSERHWSASLC